MCIELGVGIGGRERTRGVAERHSGERRVAPGMDATRRPLVVGGGGRAADSLTETAGAAWGLGQVREGLGKPKDQVRSFLPARRSLSPCRSSPVGEGGGEGRGER